jgi:hypothetical protein
MSRVVWSNDVKLCTPGKLIPLRMSALRCTRNQALQSTIGRLILPTCGVQISQVQQRLNLVRVTV